MVKKNLLKKIRNSSPGKNAQGTPVKRPSNNDHELKTNELISFFEKNGYKSIARFLKDD